MLPDSVSYEHMSQELMKIIPSDNVIDAKHQCIKS